jgi:hypothetical protein
VGNAGGKLPDGLQTLRDLELLFQLFAFTDVNNGA